MATSSATLLRATLGGSVAGHPEPTRSTTTRRWYAGRVPGDDGRLAAIHSRRTVTADERHVRDAKLVKATLAGDREAFGELVATYQRRVFALGYRYFSNEDDAADIAQRAFLKAFENLHTIKQPKYFLAWLLTIATNLAKNEIRFSSTKTFEDIEDAALSTAPKSEMVTLRRAQREAMREALSKLPDKQRRCVLLRIDAELSFREIGQAVGCSEGSARVNFHHGLKALKKNLSVDNEGDNGTSEVSHD